MVDQVLILFPELNDKQHKIIMDIRKKITVSIWKSDERKTFPLTWEGTKLCCPVKMWFDFPKDISLLRSE